MVVLVPTPQQEQTLSKRSKSVHALAYTGSTKAPVSIPLSTFPPRFSRRAIVSVSVPVPVTTAVAVTVRVTVRVEVGKMELVRAKAEEQSARCEEREREPWTVPVMARAQLLAWQLGREVGEGEGDGYEGEEDGYEVGGEGV